jgi:hypothetical protein
MEESELIWLASVAIGKKISYETFKYSDYMYDQEKYIDDVWGYVDECDNIGKISWKEKYKDFKLYF